MHGGKTPLAGVTHPTYKTGKYSRVLPSRLLERYEASLTDPELLALREEVAVLDARLTDLLSRVDTGESGQIWTLLRHANNDLRAAHRAGDTVNKAKCLAEIGELIDRGSADSLAWLEIIAVIEARRRVVETEHRRLVAMHDVLTTQEAMTLLAVVVNVVKENVKDVAALTAISGAITRLVARKDGEPAY